MAHKQGANTSINGAVRNVPDKVRIFAIGRESVRRYSADEDLSLWLGSGMSADTNAADDFLVRGWADGLPGDPLRPTLPWADAADEPLSPQNTRSSRANLRNSR